MSGHRSVVSSFPPGLLLYIESVSRALLTEVATECVMSIRLFSRAIPVRESLRPCSNRDARAIRDVDACIVQMNGKVHTSSSDPVKLHVLAKTPHQHSTCEDSSSSPQSSWPTTVFSSKQLKGEGPRAETARNSRSNLMAVESLMGAVKTTLAFPSFHNWSLIADQRSSGWSSS